MIGWWLLFVLLIILISAAYGGYRAAIWVPMKGSDPERIADLAEIKPGQIVYDLGCGDGRMLEEAAKRGATAIGYEVSLIPLFLAYLRKWRSPYGKQMIIRFRDFWFADLSDADVITIFLMESIYPKLKKKVETECKKPLTFVAYVWPVKGWKERVRDDHTDKPTVYIYQLPQ